MNFNKLAVEIYEQNKAVGWWDDPDRCVYETLQLVSTEIAEATEGERKNLMDSHLPHRANAEVELADAIIRVLDLGGRYGWVYYPHCLEESWVNKIKSIGGKHLAINKSLINLAEKIYEKKNDIQVEIAYSSLLNSIAWLAIHCEYDINGALTEKLEYNKQRADHKRENRAKVNGKKF